ncbi:hypothetical protein [Sphaerochaeta sp.]|jgi:predicted ATPase|uniref:hypothetical protein n=1 Tax=Sphaerochaeta sp. TaxID=1972642 RepID=UPI003D0A0E88
MQSPAYWTTDHRHGRGKATHTRGLDEQGRTLAKAAGRGMVQPKAGIKGCAVRGSDSILFGNRTYFYIHLDVRLHIPSNLSL